MQKSFKTLLLILLALTTQVGRAEDKAHWQTLFAKSKEDKNNMGNLQARLDCWNFLTQGLAPPKKSNANATGLNPMERPVTLFLSDEPDGGFQCRNNQFHGSIYKVYSDKVYTQKVSLSCMGYGEVTVTQITDILAAGKSQDPTDRNKKLLSGSQPFLGGGQSFTLAKWESVDKDKNQMLQNLDSHLTFTTRQVYDVFSLRRGRVLPSWMNVNAHTNLDLDLKDSEFRETRREGWIKSDPYQNYCGFLDPANRISPRN